MIYNRVIIISMKDKLKIVSPLANDDIADDLNLDLNLKPLYFPHFAVTFVSS